MHLNGKSSKIFYGWWIVLAAFFISLYAGGVVSYGFTAIFEPLVSEFNWSYTQISIAASLRGLESGLLAPFIGLVVDRWGPRRLMFGGIIIIALGLTILSCTTSLGMFYAAYALMAIGVSGCTATVLMTAVSNWFRKRAGLAISIVSSGYGCSGLLVPLLVKLIDMYGWRIAIAILGAGLLIIGLPLSLLARHKPEQYGYRVDGEKSDIVTPDKSLINVPPVEVDIVARQALKSGTFWHIGAAMAFQFMLVNAVITHIMPYLSSIGIARITAGLLASILPLLSITGRIGFGWLSDRYDKRRITTGGFAILSLGLVLFAYAGVGGTWLLAPSMVLFGIGWGGIVVMRVALIREHFGRARFGTIHGFIAGVMMLGQISGPPLAGWFFDKWGSYQGIWLIFAIFAVAGLFIIATIPPVKIQPGKFVSERLP